MLLHSTSAHSWGFGGVISTSANELRKDKCAVLPDYVKSKCAVHWIRCGVYFDTGLEYRGALEVPRWSCASTSILSARQKLSPDKNVLGNNALRARRNRGLRAETPDITRGARRRDRLHRGFSLARAGSRSPFPAAGRQAAVVGAAPRPSSDHPAGHTAPHTTQCKHPDHQGARGAGLHAPRARFTTCHQKRPPAGRARETARNIF